MISTNNADEPQVINTHIGGKDSNMNDGVVALNSDKRKIANIQPAAVTTINVNSHTKLHLLNLNREFNVAVEYYEPDRLWYRDFYYKYQGRLWERSERNGGSTKTKYYFKCNVCQATMCSFSTLKMHLNRHMKFYPYKCETCDKRFSSFKTVSYCKMKHLKEAAKTTKTTE